MNFLADVFMGNRQHRQMKQIPLVALFLFILGCSTAGMAEFEEGKHYFNVENAQPGTGDMVQVTEFFNYACPHCNNLEPHIQNWLVHGKPEFVKFEHMPAFWNDLFKNTAKAFYTAEALGQGEKLHPLLFAAIHKKGVNFAKEAAIKSVFVSEGIAGDDFDKQFNSFFVNQKINMANKQFSGYKLRSVPVFVIDGQWRTSLQDAGSHETMFEVINYLSNKAKSER